jgi:hypothetical protein
MSGVVWIAVSPQRIHAILRGDSLPIQPQDFQTTMRIHLTFRKISVLLRHGYAEEARFAWRSDAAGVREHIGVRNTRGEIKNDHKKRLQPLSQLKPFK